MEAASAQGKCTKQYAQIAERSARFLLSQLTEDQSTAKTATRSIRNSKSYFLGYRIL
jgi:hypothetical protein